MAKKYTENGRTYVIVEKGDTLSQIAVDYGGGYSNYKKIAANNGISNPDLIYVGQKIYVDGNGSGSSSSSSSNSPTITAFGLQSNSDNTLFATWTWSKTENLDGYKVLWTFSTGDGVWFTGSNTSISHDKDAPATSRQSTYNIPSNAKTVKFKVKPISKTKTQNGKETSYWTADWSTEKTYNVSELPPKQPSAPSITLDKFTLTAELSNLDLDATSIQFQVVKNDSDVFATGSANIVTNAASYTCTVHAGAKFKVRCRSCRDGIYSEWSPYTSNVETAPETPAGITDIRATSETSVYLAWEKSETARTYDIEYTEKKEYFDGSNAVTTINAVEGTSYTVTGLTSGQEYFFRVRAVKGDEVSAWCEPKSVVIGEKPSAPTTWSSTTTAIVGEPVSLYWVHNTVDGSSQTLAKLEIIVNGASQTYEIVNYTDDENKDRTSHAEIDTKASTIKWQNSSGTTTKALPANISEGFSIQWRVQTIGIVAEKPSDWSVQRTIEVHAPPSFEKFSLKNQNGSAITTVTSYPLYIEAVGKTTGTQSPIGYHLSIRSDETYETTDHVGNPVTITAGDEVYSKYFDITTGLMVELSAYHVDLANNVNYTVECTVTMSSGLNATSTLGFNVAWTETEYEPTAEIGIDTENYTASIRPYCVTTELAYYKVTGSPGSYVKSNTKLNGVVFDSERHVPGRTTSTGETVYAGVDGSGNEIYYCEVENHTPVTNVYLSVYRREFDGSFTELGTNLDGAKSTTVTDPHPALDYARYRIVAVDKGTGHVSFSDSASHPVGGIAVIIQWNEAWSMFDVTEESSLEQPAWSGSFLKLPYNIDVSDSNRPDVALVEYIGREHPVSYYGTQIGSSSTWNVEIPKKDEETLYALRRLSRWMGDAYVREPSGSGYWANITVSFSQKHKEVTIPVTLNITRVEGGA